MGAIRTASRRGSASMLAGVVAMSVLAFASVHDASAGAQPRARTARSLKTTDFAKLRYNQRKSSGSWLYEEGTATGTLPGGMRVYANIGPTLTATFTIYAHGGTIRGHASAKPHGSGRYESFAGSLTATGGTGRYSHAHGHAGFYGVLNRLNYAMTVQTTGTLSY
jgi:hypothetical protein